MTGADLEAVTPVIVSSKNCSSRLSFNSSTVMHPSKTVIKEDGAIEIAASELSR